MAGGIFFSFSGLVFPPCITNVAHLFNAAPCPHVVAQNSPYVWNAMAHYGITCFMTGTAIGFKGVQGLPKDKLISPYWGVTMFFLGAWTIGIFKFWGPILVGGFDFYDNCAQSTDPKMCTMENFNVSSAAVAWTWNWWFALLGAGFLTQGAVIFGMMNGSLPGTSPPPPPPPSNEGVPATEMTAGLANERA